MVGGLRSAAFLLCVFGAAAPLRAQGDPAIEGAAQKILKDGGYDVDLGPDAESANSTKRRSESSETSSSMSSSAMLGVWWVAVIGGAFVLVVVAALLIESSLRRRGGVVRGASEKNARRAENAVAPAPSASATAAASDPEGLAAAARYPEALVALLARALLRARGGTPLPPSWTARAAIARCSVPAPAAPHLRDVASIVERVRYAGAPADAAAWDAARDAEARYRAAAGASS